eukprot:CAMPEP_0167741894 /NCGR_PEP_ID=MMETSP0110_2-20121227/1114_1 /TAXON_ID=629695 /ORGANISM="Gymnochlora sp., Strain CCMP2014" /LENGTH=158 /DNA_ID=CAMNT_0007626005 /DNA_START=241 /DNA_END=715 /DNA_ORIENTATION=+
MTLKRRPREDLQSHILSAKIVFDMGLEDLKYERDEAVETLNEEYSGLGQILRKRGQERAYQWWHALEILFVGNDTASKILSKDEHLRSMGNLTESALEIKLDSNASTFNASTSQTNSSWEVSEPPLSAQRDMLLKWTVSDAHTKDDIQDKILEEVRPR